MSILAKTVEDVAKAIGNIANQAKVVAAILAPLRRAILGLGAGVAGLLALIRSIAAIADGVATVVDTTIGIIKDAIKKFFGLDSARGFCNGPCV